MGEVLPVHSVTGHSVARSACQCISRGAHIVSPASLRAGTVYSDTGQSVARSVCQCSSRGTHIVSPASLCAGPVHSDTGQPVAGSVCFVQFEVACIVSPARLRALKYHFIKFGSALSRQQGFDFARNRQMSLVSSGLQNKLKDSHIVVDTSSSCRRQLGRLEDQSCHPSHRVSFPCCCARTWLVHFPLWKKEGEVSAPTRQRCLLSAVDYMDFTFAGNAMPKKAEYVDVFRLCARVGVRDGEDSSATVSSSFSSKSSA